MAGMMRRESRIVVSPTYSTDFSGDFRARGKRQAQGLIDEGLEEYYELTQPVTERHTDESDPEPGTPEDDDPVVPDRR